MGLTPLVPTKKHLCVMRFLHLVHKSFGSVGGGVSKIVY